MDSSISAAWFADERAVADHQSAINYLRTNSISQASNRPTSKRDRSIDNPPVPIMQGATEKWPMDSTEPPPFPPPWPSRQQRRAMQRESSRRHPERPLGPLASFWVSQLEQWYSKLQKHFGFDPNNLAKNVRNSLPRWKLRLKYLLHSDPDLYHSVIESIEFGHAIPFDKVPPKFFRSRNPPSLAADKVRAWEAIKGDIKHGAIRPVNISEQGIPHCVCPVRTADKSNGKARFVHNSRRVNKEIDPEKAKCQLESLLRTRNMYVPQGFAIGSDFASGYHCLFMRKGDSTFLAFALHLSELTQEAKEWLFENHEEAYYHAKRSFIFEYAALPFGLSTSCKTFNNLISALVGFWRRCPSADGPPRISSYIDDILGATRSFDAALRLSIRIVYEAASLGLALRIPKCSFFPRHAIRALGSIVDLQSFTFRVTKSRAEKIKQAIEKLFDAVRANPEKVRAKLVASLLGRIWSVSCACQRAASVMTRSITDVLSVGLRLEIAHDKLSLKRLLARFWSGHVRWSHAAHQQLLFWSKVDVYTS